MILTIKEKVIIKEWDRKGLAGLRASSLALLENIGGRVSEDVSDVSGGRDDEDAGRGVGVILMRHTIKALPQGLWDKAESYCKEICFVAGIDFDEVVFQGLVTEEVGERVDDGFDD